MRKADWLIVGLLIVMGLACLLFSASSFRDMSFHQMGLSIGWACLSTIALAGIVGIVYWVTHRSKP
ncbi:hypothetical protein [Paenibacillus macerans]|uniref:hypothetical protein n=1 Tax=Paenibacillus macerans TaxID=44252 RepID=UPI003D3155D7